MSFPPQQSECKTTQSYMQEHQPPTSIYTQPGIFRLQINTDGSLLDRNALGFAIYQKNSHKKCPDLNFTASKTNKQK